MGLAALQHVGSSWTRDGTGVPCIARWISNHWTIREALGSVLKGSPGCFSLSLLSSTPSLAPSLFSFLPPSSVSPPLSPSYFLSFPSNLRMSVGFQKFLSPKLFSPERD